MSDEPEHEDTERDDHYEEFRRRFLDGLFEHDQPDDESCVMCGKEWGTRLRKDGKHYCSQCWIVWNS